MENNVKRNGREILALLIISPVVSILLITFLILNKFTYNSVEQRYIGIDPKTFELIYEKYIVVRPRLGLVYFLLSMCLLQIGLYITTIVRGYKLPNKIGAILMCTGIFSFVIGYVGSIMVYVEYKKYWCLL
ncbi:hypothetical protein IEN87_02060 [Mycoplasma hominis]|uniref:hypothetical protein n=1 Tax=Metamycoplasma hominis TaxID=2098 RepID=UPI001746115A|nr:hypothetical protein [Metamycoplasma hominis]MBD3898992.1 hypothetical protein [Metamycoplasma hominis]